MRTFGNGNMVLAGLPPAANSLLAGLTPVTLAYGDVLYQPRDAIHHVYFPGNAVVSLLTVVDERVLEVGLVGHDGMVGFPFALGIGVSPVRAIVQGAGTALRMGAPAFGKAFDASPALRRAIFRYMHSLMRQIAQIAACNRFHAVPARLARWLLMTRDRVRSGEFHLTHVFMADILGVRRVGVTEAASDLQRRGLIKYSRGNLRIVNHKGLERASCSCYKVVAIKP